MAQFQQHIHEKTPIRNKISHPTKAIWNSPSLQSINYHPQNISIVTGKMMRNTSYSSQKMKHNQHRNSKSLKILNICLDGYKNSGVNQNIKLKDNKIKKQSEEREGKQTNIQLYLQHTNINGVMNSKNKHILQHYSNFKNLELRKYLIETDVSMSHFCNAQSNNHTLTRHSIQSQKSFQQKCQEIVDNLMLNLVIFKKVFPTCKNKRTLFSKLYGWDTIFNPVFFTKIHSTVNNQLYNQQFKTNITKQSIINELGLDRHTFSAQNIYNKLRLFVAQLSYKNTSHQQLQAGAYKNKLIQSSNKLRKSMNRISQQLQISTHSSSNTKPNNNNADSHHNKYLVSQMQLMRETHNQMTSMKRKIKNMGNEVDKLARNTGFVKVNQFYVREENNVQVIESFVDNVAALSQSMMKTNMNSTQK